MTESNSEEGSNQSEANLPSQTSRAQNTAIQNNAGENPRTRDIWDKMEILLRPVAAFLTAITVTLIGLYIQQIAETEAAEKTKRANNVQVEITKRNRNTENYRLYTELLSNREEAESGLRKDIFSSILKEFFHAQDSDQGQKKIASQLLKLEILALNFGETLSLSPLFIELDNNIRTTNYETKFAEKDRKRLESLAKRVSQQQLAALSAGGESWDFEIPIKKVINGKEYLYPEDNFESDTTDAEHSLGDFQRTYNFIFSNADEDFHSIEVELVIQTLGEVKTVERNFDLNFFNFPMVDNTRLTNDQRFALVMTKFGDWAIHFSAVSFPGKYSSQRDKPFLDDVLDRLQRENLRFEKSQLSNENSE